MVNSSTNINKTNNHLTPQLVDKKKKTTTYDVGNPDPGLGYAQKCTGISESTTSSLNHPNTYYHSNIMPLKLHF